MIVVNEAVHGPETRETRTRSGIGSEIDIAVVHHVLGQKGVIGPVLT